MDFIVWGCIGGTMQRYVLYLFYTFFIIYLYICYTYYSFVKTLTGKTTTLDNDNDNDNDKDIDNDRDNNNISVAQLRAPSKVGFDSQHRLIFYVCFI